ncbi:quinone oxidoreductase family protein [Rhizobium bangladeshense]|uniref:quinone oxidoreductase family protein n=1 Tax=Rhizobium bangladeshense TaxID=1138189 RepID=UPI001C9146E4|nr:NADP-dependent oxidoreductase [Rhizobium bangladeshense]
MTNAKSDTMQAAAIDRFGGADLITVRAVSVPEVGPSDVLIRVEVAGVASWDAVEREGHYDGAFGMPSTFPYVLGWDCAGAVVAVGGQVSRFKVGDRVYAASMPLPKGGTYATYAVTDAENVSLIPAKLTIEQAGVMGWDALTALSGLEEIGLKQGDTIMIFGASGGIGHMGIQLAKRLGARVLAVASGDDGVALSQRLGADAIVNGRKDDVVAAAREFAAGGLDAALVTVGGEAADHALTSMRDGGRVACPYGVMPDPNIRPGVELIRYNGARGQDATDKLNRLIESGPFDVHVARTFPFDQVVDAHRALATHYVGKLALRVS